MFDCLSSYPARHQENLACFIYLYTEYGIVHSFYLSLIAKLAMSINSTRTQHSTVQYSTQYSTVHSTVQYTVQYCTVLYCTVLYCTVLYCTVLYCTVLYCTVLYGTVQYFFRLPITCTRPWVRITFISHVWLVLILQITEETFQTLLDRVATTKDFCSVRDNILFFLQVSTTTTHPYLPSDLYSCTCYNHYRFTNLIQEEIFRALSSHSMMFSQSILFDPTITYPFFYQCYLN